MAGKIKNIIFVFILAAMLVPGLQSIFHLMPERELHGEFVEKQYRELNSASWFSGDFQMDFEPWLEENIGFRKGLVRLNNQLDYSIFHKANAEGVVRGLNGNLFEYDYIRAWEGKDFVGERLLDKKLRGFRFLQKHLKEQYNTDLVLVLEPGKASLYPEDIPRRYNKAAKGRSNYEYISQRAKELGINLIDLNAWYMEIKDTASYPLFPLQGTHWSEFAMWYAADSLISYIEQTRGIDLPEVIIDSIEYSRELRSTDYDQGITLNLLFELEHGEMPYPQFHFVEDSTHHRPYVLAIADSYYWNIFNTRIPRNLFANEAFWYFYKKVYPDSYFGEKNVTDLDLRTETEKQDVIFYMATERFLHMVDRGFVDDMLNIYGLTSDLDELTYLKTGMLLDNVWFSEIIVEARDKGKSLEEMLEEEAAFLLWQNQPEVYYSIFGPQPFVNEIRSDAGWFTSIKERAERNKENLEERLVVEARYLLKERYPEALKKYDAVEAYSHAIRSDTAWYRKVMQKATRYYLTEEEMMRVEAEWLYLQESKTD